MRTKRNMTTTTVPSTATAGPWKTLSLGPISRRPHSICLEIGRKCGEGCPLTIRLGVWGERRKLPQRGPGLRNGFYAYFGLERGHEHHFQYFLATAGPPNIAGPGKTPRSRRAWTTMTTTSADSPVCNMRQCRRR